MEEWNSTVHAAVTARAQSALQVLGENCQHVQSRSFVLHSAHRAIAERTAQEAEFYLAKILEALEWKDFVPRRKAHIFIFEREEDWKAFAGAATLDPWTGGFFDGLDLFYRRRAGLNIRHSDVTLPHEVAHCALRFRFPLGVIPLALNEGFAEHISRRLAFQYLRPRGYNVRIASDRVPRRLFLPADELLGATRYPQQEDDLRAFYDQSERMTHFLVARRGWPKFLEYLEAVADGQDAVAALPRLYEEFGGFEPFAREYEAFAVKEEP